MNRFIRLAVELAVVGAAALVGASLTRTKTFLPEQAISLSLAGALIALIAVVLARLVGARLQESVPPLEPRQRVALRLQVGGFVVAVAGWLLAAYVHLGGGVALAAAGAVAGSVGVLYGVFLLHTKNAA